MILVNTTEEREEVSAARVCICSSGFLLTTRMERTAPFDAMAISGITTRSGIVWYVMAGERPGRAPPLSREAAEKERRGKKKKNKTSKKRRAGYGCVKSHTHRPGSTE